MSIMAGGSIAALPTAGQPFRLVSAASTNSTLVKAGGTLLTGIWVSNINAAICYLKLYDKATAPTIGTDTPRLTLGVPGNAAGAGASLAIPGGCRFLLGLGLGLTTAPADASVAAVLASEVVVSLVFV